MDVNLSRKQLFTMFGALYFVQGVIQAYQLNFFKLALIPLLFWVTSRFDEVWSHTSAEAVIGSDDV